jgi:predicted nucleotidyltransferase
MNSYPNGITPLNHSYRLFNPLSLAALLGRQVDVAEAENLHELIRDKILSEAVSL